jgi:AraC-like DNA-binding protein/CheY-like chemotaxis protein
MENSIRILAIFAFLIGTIIYIVYRQIQFKRQAQKELKAIALEFSNSLTLIYAPSEQLFKTQNNKDARRCINTIRSNSQRMQSLIQQLFEFRKEESVFLNSPIDTLLQKEIFSTTDDAPKRIVLVIDDNKEVRSLLINILSKKFEIVEAGDGKEAMEIMQTQTPSLIISDVIMPYQEFTHHIPVILLSGKSSIESRIEGIEAGADVYLSKPFHPRHLEVLIESLLLRNQTTTDYAGSHYAGLEQFKGKMIHKEDKNLLFGINKIIVENRNNADLSLDYIAGEMGISRMYLYRKIKELTEQTPTEFIRSIRLRQAERLLITTHKTVQEVMYDCGFNNKSYFYREFSKKYHVTPKEYRDKKYLPLHHLLYK